MLLSIHQPSYFPWLGLLDKIMKSDAYMIMDEVQLSDSAFQHRNIFLSNDGKVKFLTIPFNKKDYFKRGFKDLEITDSSWREKHINFLQNNYRKHPFYKEVMPFLETYYQKNYDLLVEAVVESMQVSFQLFGIQTKLLFQSKMDYDRSLKKGDLVMALAYAANASEYLSGKGAQAYLDENAFNENLRLKYNEFKHPNYSQITSPHFVTGLACLDLLFNLGIQESRALVRGIGKVGYN
jgi:hypothetical protein